MLHNSIRNLDLHYSDTLLSHLAQLPNHTTPHIVYTTTATVHQTTLKLGHATQPTLICPSDEHTVLATDAGGKGHHGTSAVVDLQHNKLLSHDAFHGTSCHGELQALTNAIRSIRTPQATIITDATICLHSISKIAS